MRASLPIAAAAAAPLITGAQPVPPLPPSPAPAAAVALCTALRRTSRGLLVVLSYYRWRALRRLRAQPLLTALSRELGWRTWPLRRVGRSSRTA